MSKLTISYIAASIDSRIISVANLAKLLESFKDTRISIRSVTPTLYNINTDGQLCATIRHKSETSPVLVESVAGEGQAIFNALQQSRILYKIISIRGHISVGEVDLFNEVVQMLNNYFRENANNIAVRALSKDTYSFSRHGKHPVRYTVNALLNRTVISVIHDSVQACLSDKIVNNNGLYVEDVEDLARVLNLPSKAFLIPSIIKKPKLESDPLQKMVHSYKPHIGEFINTCLLRGNDTDTVALELGKYIIDEYQKLNK
jgi:hypothetical protein